MNERTTVADIEGEWVDPEFESSLIIRCREAWNKEIKELTNQELSTFLRQKIAVDAIAPIAEERIKNKIEDGTEAWDDELEEALSHALKPKL